MTQLKTLEDIEFKHEWNEAQKPFAVYSEDLRAEAINWIKELEKEERGMWKTGNPLVAKHAKLWIKHFFNITDEELK